MTANNDPWASAEEPEIRQPSYYGQVQLDMFYAVLVKGTGKVPFDPQQHKTDQRVTAIDISILPIADQNIAYPVQRNMIAESKEWAGFVLPSIKALGITVRELNGKWVLAKTKPTGATYVNKQGENKDKTTLVFETLYADEAACKAAYWAAEGVPADYTTQAPSNTQQPSVNTPTPVGGSDDKEKVTAMQFLKVLVKKSEGDPAKLGPMIAQFPMVNKFFTIDSPETTVEIMNFLNSSPA